MTTAHDLFNAILQNPEDMTLRLIYADWCDERGDPRGEFIRVQCELATHPGPPMANRPLRQREAELLEAYRREWNGEIHRRLAETPLRNRIQVRRGAIRRWEYRRGFVEFLVLEAKTLLQHPEVLSQIGPINTLRILRPARRMKELFILKSPALQRMKTVELVLPQLRRDQAERQIAIQRPRTLKHVEIRPINSQLPYESPRSVVERAGVVVVEPPVRIFRRLLSLFQPK